MLVPNELDPDGEADGVRLPLPRPAEAGPGTRCEKHTPDAKSEPKLNQGLKRKQRLSRRAKTRKPRCRYRASTTGSTGASKTKRIVDVPLPKTRPDRRTP